MIKSYEKSSTANFIRPTISKKVVKNYEKSSTANFIRPTISKKVVKNYEKSSTANFIWRTKQESNITAKNIFHRLSNMWVSRLIL